MSGICSGAPGIGLDALRTGYEGSEEMLSLAIDSVMKEPLMDKDFLCCGISAIVEFLLSAGQDPGREDLRDEARRRLSLVKARAGEKGQYHCLKKGIAHMFSPGLYYGVAGIGYEMLRAAAPDMILSVFV